MEEDRLMRSMLFDFYGDLLTDKQRECFSLYYNEDLSLGEIAEQRDISRQAVWDNIRHAEASMREYERKTGLIARFEQTRRTLMEVQKLIGELAPSEKRTELKAKVDGLLDTI